MHGGDELERLERLLQERGRAGLERRVARRDAGQGQDRDAAGMDVSAQLEPGAPGDEEIDDRELWTIGAERQDGVRCIEREDDPEPLGLEEELGELGRIGVALSQQDHDLGAGVGGRHREVAGYPRQHAVRVARRDPLPYPVGDEA